MGLLPLIVFVGGILIGKKTSTPKERVQYVEVPVPVPSPEPSESDDKYTSYVGVKP